MCSSDLTCTSVFASGTRPSASLGDITTPPPGSVAAIAPEPVVAWPINLLYRRARKPSPVFAAFLAWLEGRKSGAYGALPVG